VPLDRVLNRHFDDESKALSRIHRREPCEEGEGRATVPVRFTGAAFLHGHLVPKESGPARSIAKWAPAVEPRGFPGRVGRPPAVARGRAVPAAGAMDGSPVGGRCRPSVPPRCFDPSCRARSSRRPQLAPAADGWCAGIVFVCREMSGGAAPASYGKSCRRRAMGVAARPSRCPDMVVGLLPSPRVPRWACSHREGTSPSHGPPWPARGRVAESL